MDYGKIRKIMFLHFSQIVYEESGGTIHNQWGFGNDMVAYLLSPFRMIMVGKV